MKNLSCFTRFAKDETNLVLRSRRAADANQIWAKIRICNCDGGCNFWREDDDDGLGVGLEILESILNPNATEIVPGALVHHVRPTQKANRAHGHGRSSTPNEEAVN